MRILVLYIKEDKTKDNKIFNGYTMSQVLSTLDHYIPNLNNVLSITQVKSNYTKPFYKARKDTYNRNPGDNDGKPFAA